MWRCPGEILSVSVLYLLVGSRPAESHVGAPGSRSDRRGEVRLEKSAHPFPTGGLGEGYREPRRCGPC